MHKLKPFGAKGHTIFRWIFTPFAYRREQRELARQDALKREVEEYFARLPRCMGKVVVVTPAYYQEEPIQERHRFLPERIQDGEVRGEICIAPLELASFLAARQEGISHWSDSAFWLVAFVEWLKNADVSSESAAMIPKRLRLDFLTFNTCDLLKNYPIEVFCWDCRKSYTELTHRFNGPGLRKGWCFNEHAWFCAAGHSMYKFVEDIHVNGYFPRDLQSDDNPRPPGEQFLDEQGPPD